MEEKSSSSKRLKSNAHPTLAGTGSTKRKTEKFPRSNDAAATQETGRAGTNKNDASVARAARGTNSTSKVSPLRMILRVIRMCHVVGPCNSR